MFRIFLVPWSTLSRSLLFYLRMYGFHEKSPYKEIYSIFIFFSRMFFSIEKYKIQKKHYTVFPTSLFWYVIINLAKYVNVFWPFVNMKFCATTKVFLNSRKNVCLDFSNRTRSSVSGVLIKPYYRYLRKCWHWNRRHFSPVWNKNRQQDTPQCVA